MTEKVSSPINLTPRWSNYASYLPAISNAFAKGVNQKGRGGLPAPYTIADLNFLNPRSKLWFYGEALYSAGNFSNAKIAHDAVIDRNKKCTTILGDSGGFQIGMGTLAGVEALKKAKSAADVCDKWLQAYKVRDWIVQWLELNADYAMTIDVPLWCIGKNDSPFGKCTEAQLIQLTVENLKFIKSEKRGQCKWLNVLQGTDTTSVIAWWNAVKRYRFDGWALGGIMGSRGKLSDLLYQVMLMREEGAFEAGQDWVHVLGVSTPRWAVVLTTMQQQLRATSNPKVRFTYDSASAYIAGGKTQKIVRYPQYTAEEKSWAFKNVRMPLSFSYASEHGRRAFPFASPVGDAFGLDVFNVNTDAFDRNRFDSLAYFMLQNHNVYVYLRALQEANDIASLETDDRKGLMPQSLVKAITGIESVFAAKNWRAKLQEQQAELDAGIV